MEASAGEETGREENRLTARGPSLSRRTHGTLESPLSQVNNHQRMSDNPRQFPISSKMFDAPSCAAFRTRCFLWLKMTP